MRLGDMLVRDGRLTDAQLKQSLSHQARDGGRLGTILVEDGLIDLEALTVYLGIELGIPIATGAMLERAKPPAIRLLQPKHAFRCKCVPLVVQDRHLIAAMEDPHDFSSLEAITQITGYRVLPRVCPEVRVYYYIERYYGVARPARFLKFGDKPRGDHNANSVGLPPPPAPGLPPVPTSLVPAPGPAPRLRRTRVKTFDESESLELEAADLIETLDADATGPAEPAPHVRPHRPSFPPSLAPQPVTDNPTPIAAEAALAELGTVTDRNRIVEVLLGFSASLFEAAVLFAVRDQLAFGWKAFGDLPGRAYVEHLLIPLDVPSVVQAGVAAESEVVHGGLTPSTVNNYLYKVLGCPEPSHATVGAIAIGKRIVNILYGHGKELTPLQIADVRDVCAAAASAYARLISVKKKK
jgi:hypothetical protein